MRLIISIIEEQARKILNFRNYNSSQLFLCVYEKDIQIIHVYIDWFQSLVTKLIISI